MTSEALTVAPEVVYSPIVPVHVFATNMSPPDTATRSGSINPVTSEALTVAPEVVYSPIVPAVVRDEQIVPRQSHFHGSAQPATSEGFTVSA